MTPTMDPQERIQFRLVESRALKRKVSWSDKGPNGRRWNKMIRGHGKRSSLPFSDSNEAEGAACCSKGGRAGKVHVKLRGGKTPKGRKVRCRSRRGYHCHIKTR